MRINVTSRKLSLNDEQHAWIRRRIQFALGRFTSRIHCVSATLSDINGVRGGPDKQCRLRITLSPSREIVLDDVDASIEAAASNVAEKAARSVARLLERLRETRLETGSDL